jgi:nucleoside permease NupC
MTIRIDAEFIEALIGLFFIIVLCTVVIVVIWNVLKVVLQLVGWIFLRARGAKNLEELRVAVKHATLNG